MFNNVWKDSGTQYSRALYDGSLEMTSFNYDVFSPRDPNEGHWKSDGVVQAVERCCLKEFFNNIHPPLLLLLLGRIRISNWLLRV